MWRVDRTLGAVCLQILCLLIHCECLSPAEYNRQRQSLIQAEQSRRFGSSYVLNVGEKKLSRILIEAKQREFNTSRVNGTIFPPSVSFFKTKPIIEKSQVFQIIRRMPKGGALHTHDSSITSLDWLIKNVTYRPDCYMCFDKNKQLQMHFYSKPPQSKDCKWQTVKTLRAQSGNVGLFDSYLLSNISIIVDNPQDVYVTVNDVWKKFGSYFTVVNGLFLYEPVFRDYLVEALAQFKADNVQYLEIRALLPQLYDLNGNKSDPEHTLQVYRDVIKRFEKENPDFIGCKLIQSAVRFSPPKDLMSSLNQAISFIRKYPDILRGFDLVGQEGPGHTLYYYLEDLLYPSQQSPPINIPYFFHAGETDWEGSQVDLNLVDAVLLNASRIGHGFALYKHPEVMKMIKKKNIAIEINPISNQVLKLVDDLRNHGAVSLFADNFPLVVSSDDPAAWGALPLSHDFYMAYMALVGEDDGLEVLKQLAMNSIQYSAMTKDEKLAAVAKWESKWNHFIAEMVEIL
ncbi:adenosine deaminase AGSA-like [Haliotis cracherodii]|uniref:adenosine deaminase AGSA-like n=1 Tax=Haliotis cracherodii TaxID=6455 RepID=UPI0039EA0F35